MANGWKPTCSLRYRIGSTCSPYPRLLRPMFARRRALLGKLCNIIERLLDRAYASTRMRLSRRTLRAGHFNFL